MEALLNLAKRGRSIDVNKLLKAMLDDRALQADIMELNTRFQLEEKGIDSDGFLMGTYSIWTELITGGRKKHGEHYTFRDTGQFLDSWRFVNEAESFHFEANPMKDGGVNLFEKYGEELKGLTDENLQVVIEWLKEAFPAAILRYLQEGTYSNTAVSAAMRRTRTGSAA